MDKLGLICLRLCPLLLLTLSADASPEVLVTLSTGKVAGLKLVSVVNKSYYGFQGIPYAAPPVGNRRFKPPHPPQNWNGTLKAFDIPPACSQPWRKVHFPEKYSEDCLYINVFTPYLEPPHGEPLPVMVWIHGGKHYQGSSTRYKYGADFLLTADVILITFNYRLGVFGYLNMNTRSAQGNAGLKDMVAALRWIKKEIKHFGGDPHKVTIFGGSSGGQDVSCLYLSPLSQGLFHRAISQSAQYCGTTDDAKTTNSSRTMAEMMGCNHPDSEAAVACLRRITAQDLAERQMDVATPGPGDIANQFLQSIEEDHGEEIFLPKHPSELLRTSSSKVPYLLGLNSAEGRMEIKDPKDNPTQFSDFEKDFENYLPYAIREKSSKNTLAYIIKELKNFYFGDKHVSFDTIYGFIDYMTDKMFSYNIITTAKNLSTRAPVYLYVFAFQGAFIDPFKPTLGMNLTGVSHAGELGYLFFRNAVIETHNHMSDYPVDCEVVSRMVRLWTNFAKYGNPTPSEEDPDLKVTWLPVNGTLTQHLIINRTLVMNPQPLYPNRVAIWDRVYDIAEKDMIESSYTIGIIIVCAVSILSLISLSFLIYDCCCRKRQYVLLD